MKTSLLSALLISIVVYASIAGAALYKGVDSEGNVIFSDKPFENAEKYKLPPVSVVGKSDEEPEEKVVEEKPAGYEYLSFDIISPTGNQIFGVGSSVAVSLNLKPGLDLKAGHGIWVLIDGKPKVEKSKSLTIQLGAVKRGVHKLQAQVRDAEGKVKVRTRERIFLVQKTVPETLDDDY